MLKPSAIKAICDKLLPRAALVTPNLDEAELLLGMKIHEEEDLRTAARRIVERFGCAALVKGGHLRGSRYAVDIFNDGKMELMLTAPFVRGVSTHGTGCTYSAAIAAACALGVPLPEAVERASGLARSGDAVLLSPACASMDMFTNYAHRAQVFCDAVRELALAKGQDL